ncbi:MAG TPA: GGDEF domain-containing protein [Thermoanaerobaculia bacterium]|nr:GGDEF domain-containing protein [Thermoanaerobaculia bacterium]
MSLDIHSAVTLSAVLALLMGLSLRYVLRDYPATLWPSIRLWFFGTFLQPLGWVLYGLRGEVPDFVAIVLSNAILSLAFAKLFQALRSFVSRPADAVLVYAPVVAVGLAEIVFTYVFPSIRGRVVSVSPLIAFQFAACAATMLLGSPRRRSYVLTGVSFGLSACVLVLRTLYEGLRSGTLPSAFIATPMQTAVFGVGTFLPAISTFGFVLLCNDRLNLELVRQASIDPLTGISNRRALGEECARVIAAARRRGHRLAVLLVDVDHFKRINDDYGHASGDSVLQMLVATLRSELRPEDSFGRLGGDEFVVVLPAVDDTAARVVAERLRQAVEKTDFVIQGNPSRLQVSIGFALSGPGDDDLDALLRRADLAMYAAKRAGRNQIVGPLDQPAQQTTHADA